VERDVGGLGSLRNETLEKLEVGGIGSLKALEI